MSPSGKATDSDSVIRWFKSSYPSQKAFFSCVFNRNSRRKGLFLCCFGCKFGCRLFRNELNLVHLPNHKVIFVMYVSFTDKPFGAY